jgi:hypothetical protein
MHEHPKPVTWLKHGIVNLVRMREEILLDERERAAVDRGIAALDSLLDEFSEPIQKEYC